MKSVVELLTSPDYDAAYWQGVYENLPKEVAESLVPGAKAVSFAKDEEGNKFIHFYEVVQPEDEHEQMQLAMTPYVARVNVYSKDKDEVLVHTTFKGTLGPIDKLAFQKAKRLGWDVDEEQAKEWVREAVFMLTHDAIASA